MKNNHHFNISKKDLRWLLRAASTEEARYYLNGIYVAPNGDLVAIDGHRLHMIGGGKGTQDLQDGILPVKDIKEALKQAKKDITFYLTPAGFGFDCDNDIIPNRQDRAYIDGTFPDYKRVIPDHTYDSDSLFSYEVPSKVLNIMIKESAKKFPYVCLAQGSMHLLDNKNFAREMPTYFPESSVKTAYNARHLKDLALKGQAFVGDQKWPILKVMNDNKTAVLMPARV